MCKKLKINGVEKLVPNLFDKKKYVIHIRALDPALKCASASCMTPAILANFINLAIGKSIKIKNHFN